MRRRPDPLVLWWLAVAGLTVAGLLVVRCASADEGPAAVMIETSASAPGSSPAAARWLNRGLFLAGQASLVIDLGQTLDRRRLVWDDASYAEGNPILGHRPSRDRVYVYFGAVMAAYALTWAVLDDRWGIALSVGVLTVQTPTIQQNHAVGVRVRF